MTKLRWVLGAFLLVGIFAGCGSDSTVASGTAAIGAACTANKDCLKGLTCSIDDPGGQCFKTCATNADCGADAVCDPAELKCYHRCTGPTECTRTGYGCIGYAGNDKWCDALPTVDGGP